MDRAGLQPQRKWFLRLNVLHEAPVNELQPIAVSKPPEQVAIIQEALQQHTSGLRCSHRGNDLCHGRLIRGAIRRPRILTDEWRKKPPRVKRSNRSHDATPPNTLRAVA